MTQVAFVYADWSTRYPEFTTTVNTGQASDCFLQATLYLSNADDSPVQNLPIRTMLLYMLTAHIAQIGYGSQGQAASPLVGRIDSASQGSVSVSAKSPEGLGMAGWCAQSKYGMAYWNATAAYRVARYIPPPRRRRWF